VTPLPGVTVTSGSTAPPSSPPTDTGTWFVSGLTEKGPANEAVLILSLAQYVAVFGARGSTNQTLYDSLETFFREGGSRAYVTRVVGPTPVTASVILKDASVNTLEVLATSPGEWGNGLSVASTVPSEGNFKLVVKLNGNPVGEGTFATNTEAVSWASTSFYFRLKDLGGGDPVAATKSLASGTDNRAEATETQWLAALELFAGHLGPGQVSMPGRTTSTAQGNVLTHCEAKNRTALLDGSDTATVGTLTSQATTLRALPTARYGGLFAPWVVIPGITGGTTRTVPPSALVAGLTARSDANGGNPNEAIAGVEHVARYASGVSQLAWPKAERQALSEAGINVIRTSGGRPRPYDNLTLVNPLVDSTWLQLSNARLNMAICSRSAAVAERHLFAQLDGQGIEIGKFNGDLVGEVLLPLYEDGVLYGVTAEDAFACETGPQVNTTETIGKGELHAALAVRMSPSAELVIIEVIKEAL
jgi:phage tail sheath protein FI